MADPFNPVGLMLDKWEKKLNVANLMGLKYWR